MGDNQGEGVHTLVTTRPGVFTRVITREGKLSWVITRESEATWVTTREGVPTWGKKNQEGVPTGVRTREERRLCDASCRKGVLTADQNGTLTPTHTQPVRPVFARTRKGGSVL